MELSAATVWWVLAGIAVAVELSTGTFYMLMLALGLAAGAIASHLGFDVPLQIVSEFGAACTSGNGLTVTITVIGVPLHPPADGVIV